MRRILFLTAATLIFAGCSNPAAEKATEIAKDTAQDVTKDAAAGTDKKHSIKRNFDGKKLKVILDAQPEKAKARYSARRPAHVLKLFGIEPGMTVGEALPGGGWYTKILVPYLGEDGELIGIDYSLDMWPEFSFANEEFIENKKKWPAEFVAKTAEWAPADGAKVSAMTFGDAAGDRAGTLDAVLFIRAMHNLSRYEAEGQYMTQALARTHALLKDGGIVGVVQHRAPETADDEWAIGNAGYLKQSKVVAAFEEAGFKLIKKSGVNANPKDKPSGDDTVWRLKPSLRGSEETKAAREAIGESDRMTLLFKKQ